MAKNFKEAKGLVPNETTTEETAKKNAAEAILASHTTKDARMATRINSATYQAFTSINKRRGMSNGSVVNMLISEYIEQYKHLLD